MNKGALELSFCRNKTEFVLVGRHNPAQRLFVADCVTQSFVRPGQHSLPEFR
jgi:hypothetical protein